MTYQRQVNLIILIFLTLLMVNKATVQAIKSDTTPHFSMNYVNIQDNFPEKIEWGNDFSISFQTEVGHSYQFLRDGEPIETGSVVNDQITITIDKWRENNWQLQIYNLSVIIQSNVDDENISNLVEIVDYNTSPYAVDIVSESWTIAGENALGKPDGNYSSVSYDYENGRAIYEMGMAIIDGDGDDFSVYAAGGNYTLYIQEDLETALLLGSFRGNHSFDLSQQAVSSVRYIRIQYQTGDDILIDSIEGHNVDPVIFGPPYLVALDDITIQKGAEIALIWDVDDPYAYNFSLFVDDIVVEDGFWAGEDIEYITSPETSVAVSLTIQNIRGQRTTDTVLLTLESQETTSDDMVGLMTIQVLLGIIFFAIISRKSISIKQHMYF